MKKIVVAGGTGFLGIFLSSKFRSAGHQVLIISRKSGDISWNDHDAIINSLNKADFLINLAGKSVNCRYNDRNKAEITNSRVDTTRLLGQCILKCDQPPALWINSSTATIYRHAEDRPMTEDDGEIGKGFSVNVAKQWEKAFFDFQLSNTRQVALRMAIVLGKSGGVMQPLKRLTKLGLGGKQGKGDQMVSWIHIEDIYRIILFLADHKEMNGVINCSSPHPVSNKALMTTLRDALHMKIGLPAPAWLLEIGAVLIRTETELILKSRWVLPGRLLRDGFTFKYPTLQQALNEIVQ